MSLPEHGHEPVLLTPVLALLNPQPGQVVLDCTVGRGGHAHAIAEKLRPGGTLLGLDVDPDNLTYARERLKDLSDVTCRWFHANFAEVDDVLEAAGITRVDGVLADLGVSTNQLLEAGKGLSFSGDEPLDMRLDPRITKTAADLLAELPEKELADLLYDNAQERFSRRIARKVVQTRTTEPIRTTSQLARLLRAVVPARPGQIDPATRTYQALRIAVNSETESLRDLLEAIPRIMKPGGRAVLISFHSGEDGLVKRAMRSWAAEGRCEKLTKKPTEPDGYEVAKNPRSRMA